MALEEVSQRMNIRVLVYLLQYQHALLIFFLVKHCILIA